jgi:hypothetical protein
MGSPAPTQHRLGYMRGRRELAIKSDTSARTAKGGRRSSNDGAEASLPRCLSRSGATRKQHARRKRQSRYHSSPSCNKSHSLGIIHALRLQAIACKQSHVCHGAIVVPRAQLLQDNRASKGRTTKAAHCAERRMKKARGGPQRGGLKTCCVISPSSSGGTSAV